MQIPSKSLRYALVIILIFYVNRAKTSEALRIARCFRTVQVCFSLRVQKITPQVNLCIIRPHLQTVGSMKHKFVMADAKNLHFQAQYFHLEGVKVHFNDRNRYSHF